MFISSMLESKLMSLSALLAIVLDWCSKVDASDPPGKMKELRGFNDLL